jgi:uncharacterized protein (TIGR03083 family)
VFALTAVERRRAADMFAGLSDEQWAAASLCAEWTVRDVAGHLIGPFCVSVPRFMLGSLVSGGPSRYSVKRSRQLGRRPAGEIVAILREHAGQRFVPPGTGPLAPLTDLAVHTRDVARPLGLDTTASPAAWRGALGFLTSPRAGGVSSRAAAPTDCGSGPPTRTGRTAGDRKSAGRPRRWPWPSGPPRGPGRPGRAETASPA